MKSFKDIAYQILKEAGTPLHYREITGRAQKAGLLKSDGKTPWATMNAVLSVDIKEKGESSNYIRTDPGHFSLNPKVKKTVSHTVDALIVRKNINQDLNTKQKGDIAEARVAELITLYGKEGLSCYRPISDDEGIDIIVKRRNKLDVVYLQVKSTFAYKDRGFVSSVDEKNIHTKIRMILVFVYFDLSEGDLFDQIYCIPAPEFMKLTENEKRKSGKRVFTVNIDHPERSKFAEFMIEKRELADRLIEIMDKL